MASRVFYGHRTHSLPVVFLPLEVIYEFTDEVDRAAIAALLVLVFVSWMYSEAKVRRMERVVDSAKQQAGASEEAAAAAEGAAGEYRKKIEHLETELAAIGTIARRQDEELGTIVSDVGAARRDVERARSIRAVGATAGELCAKLDELGHPCR